MDRRIDGRRCATNSLLKAFNSNDTARYGHATDSWNRFWSFFERVFSDRFWPFSASAHYRLCWSSRMQTVAQHECNWLVSGNENEWSSPGNYAKRKPPINRKVYRGFRVSAWRRLPVQLIGKLRNPARQWRTPWVLAQDRQARRGSSHRRGCRRWKQRSACPC